MCHKVVFMVGRTVQLYSILIRLDSNPAHLFATRGFQTLLRSFPPPPLCALLSSLLCVRSVQAAARYAWEQASLFTAVSSLPSLRVLEISQPAVTPDLLILRLFYRDFLTTFPQLKDHDLVWRCVQGQSIDILS